MWTFKVAPTTEDELRAHIREYRRAASAANKTAQKIGERLQEALVRENDLQQIIDERDKLLMARDNRIEEQETVVRLRELEIRGLTEIIERDRQRVDAEKAIEVARAELAAHRSQGEQRGHHAFVP